MKRVPNVMLCLLAFVLGMALTLAAAEPPLELPEYTVYSPRVAAQFNLRRLRNSAWAAGMFSSLPCQIFKDGSWRTRA